VLQVAQELVRTFVTPVDRVCLVLSDDVELSPPIELVFALDSVRDGMLQRLQARAARGDRALFPSAKADLQAAFHALDSDVQAETT
jgi:hypothetical protein